MSDPMVLGIKVVLHHALKYFLFPKKILPGLLISAKKSKKVLKKTTKKHLQTHSNLQSRRTGFVSGGGGHVLAVN